MIGGDGISKVGEAVSVYDILPWLRRSLSSSEERWVVDIGRLVIPGVEFAGWGFKILPHLASFQDVSVRCAKHISCHRIFHDFRHLLTAWPDVSEVDVLSVLALSK